jgi:hypothetical protein
VHCLLGLIERAEIGMHFEPPIDGEAPAVIEEIDATGKLVATFRVSPPDPFGYTEFRETLYGMPPY